MRRDDEGRPAYDATTLMELFDEAGPTALLGDRTKHGGRCPGGSGYRLSEKRYIIHNTSFAVWVKADV